MRELEEYLFVLFSLFISEPCSWFTILHVHLLFDLLNFNYLSTNSNFSATGVCVYPMFLFPEYLLHLIEAADTADAREKSSGCCSIVKCPWWNIFKLAHSLHLRYYDIGRGSINIFDRVYTAVIRKDMHIFKLFSLEMMDYFYEMRFLPWLCALATKAIIAYSKKNFFMAQFYTFL